MPISNFENVVNSSIPHQFTRYFCHNLSFSVFLAAGQNYGPININLFKDNSRNTRKRRGICSKLTRATSVTGVFVVNFEHISKLTPTYYC